MFVDTDIYLKVYRMKLKRVYYHIIKKQLNRLNCMRDIYVNFPSGLLEHLVEQCAVKLKKGYCR